MVGSDGISGSARPSGASYVRSNHPGGQAEATAASTVHAATGAIEASPGSERAEALQAGARMLAATGLGSKPRLPDFDSGTAKIDEAAGQALMDLLSNKTNEQSIKVLSNELRSDQARSKRTTEDRVKAIQEATNKAMEAAKKESGFFSKLFSAVSKVLGPISSVLTIAVGAALTATGVGAPLGVFLMAQGAMGVASTVMDIVDKVRESQGKEPIGWRPSLGGLVGKALEKLGVSEETAQWIGVAVEITGALAAVVGTGGAALANAGRSAGTVMNMVKGISTATSAVSAVANIGKQVINIQVAGLKQDAELADARALELKGQVDRLLKQMQQNTDFIKDISKRMQEINESISDSVSSTTEAGMAMANNMRLTG